MINKLVLSIPLALLLSGCSQAPERDQPTASAAPVPVTVIAAAEQSWPLLYEATGTVRAQTSTVIASKVQAYVREVKVQTGDRVREGQTLITLDTRDLDVNSRRAEAALDEVRSSAPEADGAVASAASQLELAQVTFNRMQDLWNKKSISHQEFDESSAQLKAAQSALAIAKARRAQVDAQAARAQQDVRAAEVTRGYAEILAPYAGVVTAKSADPGTLALPGAPLLTLEREGAYKLEASVDEAHLTAIHIGLPVTVTLDGIDRAIPSRVAEIVPAVDPASRSTIVKLDLPALPSLRSGAFGRVAFTLGHRTVLTIPAAAVQTRGQLQSAMAVEGQTARTRLITTGQSTPQAVEVLSGLTAGDKIIVAVPAGVSDGSPVEIRP
jgi:RND family efflux transporter MFP subunit